MLYWESYARPDGQSLWGWSPGIYSFAEFHRQFAGGVKAENYE